MIIKLIWDIKGADAEQTAKHHEIHLKEFAEREKMDSQIGVEVQNEMHSIAFMTVDKSVVYQVRDALKPHRAEIVEE